MCKQLKPFIVTPVVTCQILGPKILNVLKKKFFFYYNTSFHQWLLLFLLLFIRMYCDLFLVNLEYYRFNLWIIIFFFLQHNDFQLKINHIIFSNLNCQKIFMWDDKTQVLLLFIHSVMFAFCQEIWGWNPESIVNGMRYLNPIRCGHVRE